MENGTDRDAVVIGAGIGGLTAALCLHRTGHRVTVLERVRAISPLGVGVNLQPPAVAVLSGLGLGDRLAERGVASEWIMHVDHRGTRRYDEPRGLGGGHRWPQYAVHRGELQTMLLERVRAVCGPDAVRTGMSVTGVHPGGDPAGDGAARVTATDRDTGAGRTLRAGLVVGADGLHSAVRAALHPDDGPLLHSGTVMWRGTTAASELPAGHAMVLARDPAGTLLVAYPIRLPGQRRTVVNWVVLAPVREPGPVRASDAGWNRPGSADDVLALLRGWDLGVPDVTGLIRGAAEILEFPMVDRDPLARWGTGRVTLLGDAAHPMYPVGANGATQAIVDARVLADAVTASGDPASGLAGYERERIARTSAIVAANREMHRADHGDARSVRTAADRYHAVLHGPGSPSLPAAGPNHEESAPHRSGTRTEGGHSAIL